MRWILLAILLAPAVRAAQPAPNMEKYYLVLLKRPANPAQFEPKALEDLQKRHLAHMQAMFQDGKMVVAGPFDEQKDPTLRGLCLYRVGSLEEARKLASGDPMVQAGRLEVEVLAWWVEKGAVTFRPPPTAAGK
jgi:uncharacterized protein YciI